MLVFDWFAALALAGQPVYEHVPRFASKVNDDRRVIGLRARVFFHSVAFDESLRSRIAVYCHIASLAYNLLSIDYPQPAFFLSSILRVDTEYGSGAIPITF